MMNSYWVGLGLLITLAATWLLLPLLRQSAWKSTVLIIGLLLVTFLVGSHYWANRKAVIYFADDLKHQQAMTNEFRKLGTPREIISRVGKKVAHNQNDPAGWELLGKLFYTEKDYLKASAAFANAWRLQPSNPRVSLQYAQALLLGKGEEAQQQVEALLLKTVSLEPNNVTALNLLAIIALNQNQKQQAISYWQKIVDILPANDPLRSEYQQAIFTLSTGESSV